jgi:ABC-type transport system involved in multi-copper enzyme maturation permease subunit
MKVPLIAKNTFKECVRDRVLYNLAVFSVLMIASSLILGAITIGDVKQIIVNLGLSTLSVFGTLIAIFIGIQLVFKEIDKKTIYSLLTKPVTRHEFILGKYLGLAMTLAVNVAVMMVGIYAAILYLTHRLLLEDLNILLGGLLIYIELLLVIAIALLFSTFSTPALSALFTFTLYVIGHFNADILLYAKTLNSPLLKGILKGMYYLLPNFGNFQIISHTAHSWGMPWQTFLYSTAYGLLYTSIVLFFSMGIFQNRNFK